MNLASFFGSNQSHYSCGYFSEEQVEEGTNKALDLIDVLNPHFLKAIEGAFIELKMQV